jgi:DNA ligase (NAD+)
MSKRATGSLERARKRVEALRQEIRRHDHLYHVEDRPEISDQAYDALYRELVELEERFPDLASPDSPTQRVAGAPLDVFPSVEHAAPLLSLESHQDEGALRRFHDRLARGLGREPEYVVEPKLDGLSIELVYEEGVFVRAATRGDGYRGEGVTENVRTIRSVPLRLSDARRPIPPFLAVRGEVILSIRDFESLNKSLLEQGRPLFANPRNAAAGSLRQLDARITARRPLDVFCYDILKAEGARLASQQEVWEALRSWGLKVEGSVRPARSLEEILAYHRDLESRRDDLPHEIDGIVVKLDDLDAREEVGTTARHPRWAFALKFPPRKEVTRVEEIVPSVGRSGIVTPIALLRPVEIGGVTVSRATLHNREEVERKDVRKGDLVRVQRAGDVIPQVVEHIEEPGREREAPFRMPETCPSCGTPLVERGPFTLCPASFDCPAQLAGRLQHLASRPALDIEGLGGETARLLTEVGLVESLPDVFALEPEQLLPLEGFAEKSAGKLVESIGRASHTELHRFLYGLGIPEVGVKVARDLALHFGSIDALRQADEGALQEVPGVGPRMAEQITTFFRSEANRELLDALLERVTLEAPETPRGGALEGLRFVFTGTLSRLSRRQAQELVEAHGARALSSVSKETNYVVVGEDPGSKAERAEKLAVPILSEDELVALLEERGVPFP